MSAELAAFLLDVGLDASAMELLEAAGIERLADMAQLSPDDLDALGFDATDGNRLLSALGMGAQMPTAQMPSVEVTEPASELVPEPEVVPEAVPALEPMGATVLTRQLSGVPIVSAAVKPPEVEVDSGSAQTPHCNVEVSGGGRKSEAEVALEQLQLQQLLQQRLAKPGGHRRGRLRRMSTAQAIELARTEHGGFNLGDHVFCDGEVGQLLKIMSDGKVRVLCRDGSSKWREDTALASVFGSSSEPKASLARGDWVRLGGRLSTQDRAASLVGQVMQVNNGRAQVRLLDGKSLWRELHELVPPSDDAPSTGIVIGADGSLLPPEADPEAEAAAAEEAEAAEAAQEAMDAHLARISQLRRALSSDEEDEEDEEDDDDEPVVIEPWRPATLAPPIATPLVPAPSRAVSPAGRRSRGRTPAGCHVAPRSLRR